MADGTSVSEHLARLGVEIGLATIGRDEANEQPEAVGAEAVEGTTNSESAPSKSCDPCNPFDQIEEL